MGVESVSSAPTARAGFSIEHRAEGLVIEGPGAPNRAWPLTAALFGAPWLLAVAVGSVWYLGWGVPDSLVARVLLWVVMMAFTVALHALALLSIWSTVYGRSGRETLVISPDRITITRRAGRVPISLHIRRTIIERAEMLPQRPGQAPHPRIEVRSWRSAVRFGAALDDAQAQAALSAVNELFERDEQARHALTHASSGDTIAPTRPEGRASDVAMTGTSRTEHGSGKRAGTVKARGARRFRTSPPSFGPNGRKAK